MFSFSFMKGGSGLSDGMPKEAARNLMIIVVGLLVFSLAMITK